MKFSPAIKNWITRFKFHTFPETTPTACSFSTSETSSFSSCRKKWSRHAHIYLRGFRLIDRENVGMELHTNQFDKKNDCAENAHVSAEQL